MYKLMYILAKSLPGAEIQLLLRKVFFNFVILLFVGFLGWASPAYAHRPHDVVTQIELSPNYSENQTLFILVRGNLFKSSDGGNNWQRAIAGLDNQGDLTDLKVSQQNPKVILLSSSSEGIYRSQDEGKTWRKSNQGLDSLEIDRVAIAPNSEDIAFAVSNKNTVYRTENGGKQWKIIPKIKEKITAIGFSSDGKTVVLGTTETLWMSPDRGETWKPVSRRSLGIGGQSEIVTIESLSNNPDLWLATAEDGTFKSSDRGQSWQQVAPAIANEKVQDLEVIPGVNGQASLTVSTANTGTFQYQGQAWQPLTEGLTIDPQAHDMKVSNFTDLEIAPDNQTVFLASFDGLFKSSDGAQTWREFTTLTGGTVVAMAVSPNYSQDNTIAVATYVGGVYLSYDGGKTWEIARHGLELPKFTGNFQPIIHPQQDPRRHFDIAFSPSYATDKTLFASLLWTKVLKSENQGKNWDVVSLNQEKRGLTVVPSPTFARDRTVYVGSQKGTLFRSTNGGKSFAVVGKIPELAGNYSPSIVLSPDFANDQTLFGSGAEGVYKSTDGGKTWTGIAKGTVLADAVNIQLAISPNYSSDSTLLAGTKNGLFRSQDGGSTWQLIDSLSKVIDGSPYIEAIALSPDYSQDRTAIVSVRGNGTFKTTDGGQTFKAIGNSDIPLARMDRVPSSGRAIVFSPNYSQDRTIYGFGAARSAIFRSTDGGETWETFSLPLFVDQPYSPIRRLQLWFELKRNYLIKLGSIIFIAGIGYSIIRLFQALKQPTQKRVWQVLIVTVLALGIFFRFANVDNNVYSADEVRKILRLSGYTSDEFRDTLFNGDIHTVPEIQHYQTPNSEKNFGDALRALSGNAEHPPLYFILTRFWMQIFNTPVAARWSSILFSLAALPCIYWLCIELFSAPLVGWVAVMLAAISPFQIMVAQNASQYSLWVLITSLSSWAFLRALRKGDKGTWIGYALTLILGLYTHLFFAIVAFGHGLYFLLRKPVQSWKNFQYYSLTLLAAAITFIPWAVVILTNIDKVDKNTKYYRQFSNNNIHLIVDKLIANIGNIFLDFHNQTRLESYFDLFLIALVLYGIYFLWQKTKVETALFVSLLLVCTLIAHITPDLIFSSARSLQSRYYVPSFLAVQLIVAYLLASFIHLLPMKAWQQHLGRLGLLGLLSAGILSGVFITQINDWGMDDQKGTASGINLQVAPVVNKSSNPLVISNSTHSFILALSYLTNENVKFQLVSPEDSSQWSSQIDLEKSSQQFNDLFIYKPSPELLDFIKQLPRFKLEPIPNVKKGYLYKLASTEVDPSPK